jgi:DNA polymerase-3 subunit alpha
MRHNQEDENRGECVFDLIGRNMMSKLLRQTIPLYRQRKFECDILLCVRWRKQTTPMEVVALAIVTDCPIKNTISSRRRNEKAFANLPEAISNISEIVDKIEILARGVTSKI